MLPKNGRVLIIDDEAQQVIPLQLALSKFQISTTWYNGEIDYLPEIKYNDVRIIILDLNLVGSSSLNWVSDKSIIISTFTNILEKGIPYVIFLWSMNETEHLEDVSKLFDEELKEYKPIVPLISINKSDFFDEGFDKDEKPFWVLKNPNSNEVIETLKHYISEGISKNIDSIEALFKWENIVSESSAYVVNDIINLALLTGDINSGLKSIYFNLAKAYWGKHVSKQDFPEIIKSSLPNLNLILNDYVDSLIAAKLQIEHFIQSDFEKDLDSLLVANVNSKLLLSFDKTETVVPGNVYNNSNDRGMKNRIIQDIIDDSTFIDEFEPTLNKDETESKDSLFQKFINTIRQRLASESTSINIEVTPICDYSQKKYVNNRIIGGVLLPIKYLVNLKRTADFFYTSAPILYNKEIFVIVIDFRYLESKDSGTLKNSIFRIRHVFLNEIQVNLARQISRPGLIYV